MDYNEKKFDPKRKAARIFELLTWSCVDYGSAGDSLRPQLLAPIPHSRESVGARLHGRYTG